MKTDVARQNLLLGSLPERELRLLAPQLECVDIDGPCVTNPISSTHAVRRERHRALLVAAFEIAPSDIALDARYLLSSTLP